MEALPVSGLAALGACRGGASSPHLAGYVLSAHNARPQDGAQMVPEIHDLPPCTCLMKLSRAKSGQALPGLCRHMSKCVKLPSQ